MEGVPVNGMQPISLHYELGIMFGFLAACILTVGVYYIFWQATQRRAEARDEARRKDLLARGFHHQAGGYHDKALHRYASRDPIAQTQGQMLEFLTEPAQFKNNSNNNNSPHDSSHRTRRFSDDDEGEDLNSVTTAAATAVTNEKHADLDETGHSSSLGLRIDTHHDHRSSCWREEASNLLQTGSAISNRTPLSTLHTSVGQNTKDVI